MVKNSIAQGVCHKWDSLCACREAQRALEVSLGHGVRLPEGRVAREHLLEAFLNRHGLAVVFGNEATVAQLVETAGIFYSAFPAEERDESEGY